MSSSAPLSSCYCRTRSSAAVRRRRWPRVSSRLRCGPEQALLDDRHDEGAVPLEDAASGETEGTGGGGTVLVVEQPVVGPERAVEPHGMVEAGAHDEPRLQAHAMREVDRIEQRHVRRVGNEDGVEHGV